MTPKQPTLRSVRKAYFGLFRSHSLRFSAYLWPWPFTSAATARMKVSVMPDSSSPRRLEELPDRRRGLLLSYRLE